MIPTIFTELVENEYLLLMDDDFIFDEIISRQHEFLNVMDDKDDQDLLKALFKIEG